MIIGTQKPSKMLSEYVNCIWMLENNSSQHTELVYPTGKIQLLFHYKEPFDEVKSNGASSAQPQFTVCGQKTTFSNVTASGRSGMIGIVFHPHAASALFPFNLNEITDKSVSIEDIFTDWKYNKEKFMECTDNRERVKMIESFLMKKINIENRYHYSVARFCVADINAKKGALPIKEILNKYNVTERTLQRIFNRYVGVTPKKYSDFVKLEYAIQLCKTKTPLMDVSFKAGYYDQSHFVKTLKEYTGLTPTGLIKLL
jgi:AraC-like DNA-binding protein